MLLIRLMLGLTFVIHGSQKILNNFNEPIHMFQTIGLPGFFGIILSLFEFFGGILILLGVLSNYIAVDFIIIMLGALFTVHLPQGYTASEMVIILLIMNISIIFSSYRKKLIQFY